VLSLGHEELETKLVKGARVQAGHGVQGRTQTIVAAAVVIPIEGLGEADDV
jgi:hypothetical protein